jgi:hypothetical protein
LNPLIDLLPEGGFHLDLAIVDVSLSYQLLATCGLFPEKCALVAQLAAFAQVLTRALYGYPGEGTLASPKEGDAFEHCLWSGLTALAIGPSYAWDFVSRYEATGDLNDPFEREYDLHNDRRGIDRARLLEPLGPGVASALLFSYCGGG